MPRREAAARAARRAKRNPILSGKGNALLRALSFRTLRVRASGDPVATCRHATMRGGFRPFLFFLKRKSRF
jgi:hypothetical protein